jgi:pyrimidine-specific ribonucleoside hydrolase
VFFVHKTDIVFDMETSDPDDVLTLCIRATHPCVNLLAVTVTPGSIEQVGVVRHLLDRLGRQGLPIGSFSGGHSNPNQVSDFHRRWLGDVGSATPTGTGIDILAEVFRRLPEATLLTGAPLKNPGTMLQRYQDVRIGTWVAQGGFAGDSVVPPELRLPKFAGRETCPTFNFNGAPLLAEEMIASDRIGKRFLVSKNVCHGVIYDQAMHARVAALPARTPGMNLVYEAMSVYLSRRPEGKAFHDPLAAAVAIDRDVCTFREVEVYRERGAWGARDAGRNTATFISIDIDRERFFGVLTEAA